MSGRGARSRTLLLDLDGTLIDPAEGIIASFQHALKVVGADVPAADSLRWVIGPPLRKSFPTLVPERAVEDAVAAYREYYGGGGMYRARVYDGIPEALERLRASGWLLHVCTVKPRVFAVPLTERLGLDGHFEGVYGAELGGRFEDKADLIEHILAEKQVDAADVIMVGDRDLDVHAARLVTQHHHIGLAAMDQPKGHGGIGRMEQAALPLDHIPVGGVGVRR